MGLMATDTSAQRAPIEGGLIRRRLLFYSRLYTNGTAGIDIFSHNVNHMPGPLRNVFCCCLPQPSLVKVVLESEQEFLQYKLHPRARTASS